MPLQVCCRVQRWLHNGVHNCTLVTSNCFSKPLRLVSSTVEMIEPGRSEGRALAVVSSGRMKVGIHYEIVNPSAGLASRGHGHQSINQSASYCKRRKSKDACPYCMDILSWDAQQGGPPSASLLSERGRPSAASESDCTYGPKRPDPGRLSSEFNAPMHHVRKDVKKLKRT